MTSGEFVEVILQCMYLILEVRNLVFEIRHLLLEECVFTIEVRDRCVRHTDGIRVGASFGLRVNQRHLRRV